MITLLSPVSWYHVLKWREEPIHAYRELPERIKLELEALNLSPEGGHQTLTVLAKPEELKRLGLNPEKPITLEELKRRMIEQEAKKDNTNSH